jgi:hypothetical protein
VVRSALGAGSSLVRVDRKQIQPAGLTDCAGVEPQVMAIPAAR